MEASAVGSCNQWKFVPNSIQMSHVDHLANLGLLGPDKTIPCTKALCRRHHLLKAFHLASTRIGGLLLQQQSKDGQMQTCPAPLLSWKQTYQALVPG